jgi:hypothetical protein
MLIYTVGRSYLLEAFHAELECNQVRFVSGSMARKAYEQLNGLELELRETGTIYKCPAGHHDDLAISCAMVAWAARHPHRQRWFGTVQAAHHRWPKRPSPSALGWT